MSRGSLSVAKIQLLPSRSIPADLKLFRDDLQEPSAL